MSGPTTSDMAGATGSEGDRPFLELRGIGKAFPGVKALSDVDLDIRAGEVHALMGENGAGKSTLMKIVAGVYQPDTGAITLDGQPARFAHPREAQEHGISIIHQDFNLLPERTVAHNIFLGREPKAPLGRRLPRDGTTDGGDPRRPRRGAIDLATGGRGSTLGRAAADRGDRQGAILRRSHRRHGRANRLALTRRGRGAVRSNRRAAGARHRLRLHQPPYRRDHHAYPAHYRTEGWPDGGHCGDGGDQCLPARLDDGWTRAFQLLPSYAEPNDIGEPVLEIINGGSERLHDIDLTLRRGEVVGLAGLDGAGRTEVARAIFGVDPFTTGTVRMERDVVHFTHPRQAIRAGIGFLTEDRKIEGLILPQSIRDNNLLALRILPGVNVLETRWAAADIIFQENNINVGVEFSEGDRAQVKSIVTDYIAQYGQIDGVWMDAGQDAVAVIEAFEDLGMEVPPVVGEDQPDFLQAWSKKDLTAVAPTCPNFQWRTPIIAATMILSGEEVSAEWVLPQPTVTQENLEEYLQPNMPPQHYALCNCEDMPVFPERWAGEPQG